MRIIPTLLVFSLAAPDVSNLRIEEFRKMEKPSEKQAISLSRDTTIECVSS